MEVRCFRGRECEHPHEHRQLAEIVALLEAAGGAAGGVGVGAVALLTGVRVPHGEIDCAVLTRRGVVVLELKAYTGEIYGQENGTWQVKTADGTLVPLLAGNLMAQLEKERYALIAALAPLVPEYIRDFDGTEVLARKSRAEIVAAWGYFGGGSTYPPGQVDPGAYPWFDIVTPETLVPRLREVDGPLARLPRYLDPAVHDLMAALVDALHLDEYEFATGEVVVPAPLLPADTPPAVPPVPAPQGLNEYHPASRRHALILLKGQLAMMDANLEDEGTEVPPGPQRIRGIAGSGKTRLLCQKAASMHVQHPDWEIALVFQTRALYAMIEERVRRSVAGFGGVWDRTKLRVLHAWGGTRREGFYSVVAMAHGIIPENVRSLRQKRVAYSLPQEALAYCCADLMDRTEVVPLFDAVLIDEGQDLVVDDPGLLHQGRQPFYALAYAALRPVDEARPALRRLIWAYDEYQNTTTMRIPTAPALFGNDPALRRCVFGTYPSGIKKSVVMRSCWRTPGPVITAAHALGMGLLYKGGMIAGPRRRTEWEALGYQVEGAFRSQRQVTLSRPREHSGNPMPRIWDGPLLELRTFASRQEELAYVAEAIRAEIQDEHLDPSESILVVSMLDEAAHIRKIAEAIHDAGVNVYISSAPAINTFSFAGHEADPDRFRAEYAVTVTGVNRAKGNEADHVYCVSLDYVARNDASVAQRNRLSVGMTRTRAWVTLTGTGDYPLYREVEAVIAAGEAVTFTYRDRAEQTGTEDEDGSVSYQQELT
ncbi:superfamily I DNA and RNA helicase [Methanofollis sp. W23]|uniref:NERD domain-containing protein n=1 Tax=Methanofollis sp. W23 TaxID=2817849 RepID=UPI001AE1835F|nr:nuclease-related domain-containing DEAD/DEAH box helicase [Methanofollis sp. W23]MBP2146253.1 superfamily I DNA and RNA helicase [Methanofollis sp. W23]